MMRKIVQLVLIGLSLLALLALEAAANRPFDWCGHSLVPVAVPFNRPIRTSGPLRWRSHSTNVTFTGSSERDRFRWARSGWASPAI